VIPTSLQGLNHQIAKHGPAISEKHHPDVPVPKTIIPQAGNFILIHKQTDVAADTLDGKFLWGGGAFLRRAGSCCFEFGNFRPRHKIGISAAVSLAHQLEPQRCSPPRSAQQKSVEACVIHAKNNARRGGVSIYRRRAGSRWTRSLQFRPIGVHYHARTQIRKPRSVRRNGTLSNRVQIEKNLVAGLAAYGRVVVREFIAGGCLFRALAIGPATSRIRKAIPIKKRYVVMGQV